MEDEDPYATEDKVRELIKRKLRITREIPFNRVSREFHGPEFRGQKPVQVELILLLTQTLETFKFTDRQKSTMKSNAFLNPNTYPG